MAVAVRLEAGTLAHAAGAKVGFDRPYAFYYNMLPTTLSPLTNGSGEFLLWEFPLAFWLEQHGYDVTYVSNLDTHGDPRACCGRRGSSRSATTSTGPGRCSTTCRPATAA